MSFYWAGLSTFTVVPIICRASGREGEPDAGLSSVMFVQKVLNTKVQLRLQVQVLGNRRVYRETRQGLANACRMERIRECESVCVCMVHK